YKKAGVLKHARRLFRDSTHKLKNRYFIDLKLKTKEERSNICFAHNSLQKMPHFNGTNEKADEQIFEDVLGKDTHGYLQAYGQGKSISKHFHVKPLQIDLHQDVIEEARNDIDNARKEAKDARKEAEEARKDAELAMNEAEISKSDVHQKIVANNKVWEKKLKRTLQEFVVGTYENNDTSSDGSSA
ncbi:Polyphosphate kinase, partial [Bienertia sinuspersici]